MYVFIGLRSKATTATTTTRQDSRWTLFFSLFHMLYTYYCVSEASRAFYYHPTYVCRIFPFSVLVLRLHTSSCSLHSHIKLKATQTLTQVHTHTSTIRQRLRRPCVYDASARVCVRFRIGYNEICENVVVVVVVVTTVVLMHTHEYL